MPNNYFSDKIATFDFDRFYTPKRRMLLHATMWLLFAVFLLLSYILAYEIPPFNSFILTCRMMLCNMAIFYIFFYIILPRIFEAGRAKAMILFILSIPVCIYLWLIITYLITLLYNSFGFDVPSGELKGIISKAAEQTFTQAIAFRRVLSQVIIVISILSPFFFVKILFEIFRMYNRTLKLQRQKMEIEIQNINMEKDFLKAQLNPHFLFNTLNNLYSLTLKKDNQAPEVILNLSDMMSYTLYESNTEKVTLTKELEFIRNYFNLEKMRYPADKNIRLNISGDVDAKGLYIAPLLTFSCIENAFKYGLKSTESSFIFLDIKVKDSLFYFQLENDVEQINDARKVGGIGLENMQKRLQLLYPGKHELQIEDVDHKFKVTLKIALKN
ncbi:sensor histidine kinase [Elizabethkingia meningoseptica]|uniref:sensor histidine kinase n=1 Tax=Elizabethkingia meningoseptica TaxID=238 RepID=UPI0013654459|nr:histidine kinase [Elizabethkingia meningoseptica]MDE5488141.1 histidine kinase [Elizabethkingia meningoseptica]MVW91151.1 histidine kinase [Elizabethkingia meningoseptica]